MAAIVQTIVTSFIRFFDFLRYLWMVFVGWINFAWSSSMAVLDALLAASLEIFLFGIRAVTDVLLFIFTIAVALLPTMPDVPQVGSLSLGGANRYVPITEVLALAGVWATIFGAIGAYKLAKFVRGAG